jgi:hypothetical protein
MAKQPIDLVLPILDIQRTLSDHGKRFDHIEQRLDEINDSMIASLGLASHANVRHESVRKDIDDLKKRVKRLEAKQ